MCMSLDSEFSYSNSMSVVHTSQQEVRNENHPIGLDQSFWEEFFYSFTSLHPSSLGSNFFLLPVSLRGITHPYGKKRMDAFSLYSQQGKPEEASICNTRLPRKSFAIITSQLCKYKYTISPLHLRNCRVELHPIFVLYDWMVPDISSKGEVSLVAKLARWPTCTVAGHWVSLFEHKVAIIADVLLY